MDHTEAKRVERRNLSQVSGMLYPFWSVVEIVVPVTSLSPMQNAVYTV